MIKKAMDVFTYDDRINAYLVTIKNLASLK